MTQWISVKDRLPEKNEYTLLYCPTDISKIRIGALGDDICIYDFTQVTYWMPLPEFPSE